MSRRPSLAVASARSWLSPRPSPRYEGVDVPPELRAVVAPEEAATDVVDTILRRGGRILFDHHIARKVKPFAAEMALDAAMSQLEMCVVPHEEGDSADDWALEDEPLPQDIDSWASFAVKPQNERPPLSPRSQKGVLQRSPVRKRSQKAFRRLSEASNLFSGPASRQNSRAASVVEGSVAVSSVSVGKGKRGRVPRDPRVTYLVQEVPVIPPWEEKMRKEMANRGRFKEPEPVPLVDEPQEERNVQPTPPPIQVVLPKDLMINVDYLVPATPRANARSKDSADKGSQPDATLKLGQRPKAAAKQRPQTAPARGHSKGRPHGHANQEEEAFTDGCNPDPWAQPTYIESMQMQPGVTLRQMGQRKTGPPHYRDGDTQTQGIPRTRREYQEAAQAAAQAAAKEAEKTWSPERAEYAAADMVAAHAAKVAAQTAAEAAPSTICRTPSKERRVPSQIDTQDDWNATFGGQTPVPRAVSARQKLARPSSAGAIMSRSRAEAANLGAPSGTFVASLRQPGDPVESAPPPRRPHTTGNALRWQPKNPRQHVATLGAPFGTCMGSPAPPIGATMGHGLLRSSGSPNKDSDSLFFPKRTSARATPTMTAVRWP